MSKKKKWLTRLIVALSFLGLIVFALSLARIAQENEWFRNLVSEYSYFGVFFISLLSGFNVIIPIPAVSFMPLFLEAGLSFWITIIVMTLGMTVADVVAYIVGILGRDVSKPVLRSKFIKRLDTLHDRYYWAPIIILFFYAMLAPLPNEFIVIPLGFMRYRLRDILPALLLGNGIFHIVAAYGIVSLFSFL